MDRRAVIVGAGGHARAVAGILAQLKEIAVIGAVDKDRASIGEVVSPTGWRIIGSFEDLPALRADGVTEAYLALGDNATRQSRYEALETMGFALPPLIHPTAWLEEGVVIGAGSVLCARAILGAQAAVGRGCIVNTGAIADHETTIDDFAHLATGSRVAGRVRIGARSFIGIGSSVADNYTIGEGTVIGAGSVVVDHIPAGVVAYGTPARVARHA